MKRNLLAIVVIILSGSGIALISACRKSDTSPPVITVKGASKINISLNSAYNDQGATASDVVDGSDVVSSDFSTTNPDVNLAGTYTIHYTAVDNAGNTTTAIRTVIVSNNAKNIVGIYSVIDTITGKNAGTYSYNVVVTPSNTQNNFLYLADFSGLGYPVTVLSAVTGSTITVNPAAQMPSGMNDPGRISGSGTVVTGSKISSFNYIISYSADGDTCRSTWTKLP